MKTGRSCIRRIALLLSRTRISLQLTLTCIRDDEITITERCIRTVIEQYRDCTDIYVCLITFISIKIREITLRVDYLKRISCLHYSVS